MGTLYIVSTPIGNLKDITLRSLETLKSVDYILAEDTRVTGKLLKNYEIDAKMVSFNDFNEESRIGQVIIDLTVGKSIALVSDAGTPLVSDPGFKLVREAIKAQIRVESIPGSSAVIAALTISGLPPDKFLFLGYLPKKEIKRRKLLTSLFTILQSMEVNKLRPNVILYESPHRILRTMKDIKDIFGNIHIVIAKELTKLHEEVIRGSIMKVIILLENKPVRGELTILF
ncbi:16S rRNA (cytidine(1402)-2'-O)-methyltransferase [Candidatus Curtissbacteria bacterium RIFCSPHIGHO2_02_FULL_40_17]|uniref:Ribosomal RNA small subunit methyltransferase I n=4 Tax=Candidatus Curtissiibacteriota TaxID=1752717 RepID=A0A1F5GGX7_9BACT|nr:MAG: 16S rRNA (cytidine(1402)-2'-O)-methyltransferase [Candidatus Curtissbacteria bacterium RIFCSPHIGHO2_01_FULL_40_12]OGD91079.1 MAG: 16S rRNA (cytidine(1402)-2'-O)-methyltransferase [Candidatus Curtissbacteria bacterium RIFCSPHIGHO2_02_FULL_40_17]OGE05489.1 MAG: 16S rRNA (cytidine(1402)-2'-O)-methyltransferase [Candidatus Curtissbacteria bacterium RIFCSPHIGHO2_12_FULL_41_17]OGE07109.1 MAG: 16S rRNA (cytidine(1402)-2'-O)-methyltransferase [Candidatus Curtissbacteria bacterium RIFCSPLOWO2_02_